MIADGTSQIMVGYHAKVSKIIFIVTHNELIMTDEINDNGTIQVAFKKIIERCRVPYRATSDKKSLFHNYPVRS